MPKKKVRKSVARRFKVTKTGKVLFGHQYASHHKSSKSKSRLRRLKIKGVLAKGFAKKVKQMLGKA